MLLPWRVPRVPILYYHEIGITRARHIVHRDDFSEQMHWLRDAGFDVLSLDRLLDVYAGRHHAPARPVLVTFDDGRAGVLRHAAPLLERLHLPATLYVVTRWLEGREIPDAERYSEFVSTHDLAELREAGIEIGSHTETHRTLKRLDEAAVIEEVANSRRWLEDALSAPVAHFSFPKGRSSRIADRAVRRAGYRSAVRTGDRWNGHFPNRLGLWRLRVDGTAPATAFRRRLASHRMV